MSVDHNGSKLFRNTILFSLLNLPPLLFSPVAWSIKIGEKTFAFHPNVSKTVTRGLHDSNENHLRAGIVCIIASLFPGLEERISDVGKALVPSLAQLSLKRG